MADATAGIYAQAPSRGLVLGGAYQVSGPGIRCADIENTEYIISFGNDFGGIPDVTIQTSMGDSRDSLSAVITRIASDHVVVTATGTGIHDHQLCAYAYIRWTASR